MRRDFVILKAFASDRWGPSIVACAVMIILLFVLEDPAMHHVKNQGRIKSLLGLHAIHHPQILCISYYPKVRLFVDVWVQTV